MNVAFRPRAARDLARQLAHLEFYGSAALANRFERMLTKTLIRIQENPELGSPWDSDAAPIEKLRFRIIERFQNHVVFYQVTANSIEVIRVLHGSQDIETHLQEIDD